jgi:Eukaryotic aspartyl protease
MPSSREKMARSLIAFGGVLFATITAFAACSSSSDAPSIIQGSNGDDSSVGANDSATDAGPSADGSSGDSAVDAGALIELDLTGCPQSGYNAPFSIGGSDFALTVDTGSSDIGVVSASCSGCGTPDYTPGASATDQHQTGMVSYSSGAGWSGEIFSDTFSPGKGLAPQTKLVEITSQADDFFASESCAFGTIPISYQGIAGFGVVSSATANVDAPMKALTGAGMPNIFSLALCGLGGKMWLGGFDPASASAAPKYTPLLSGFYYNIKLNDFSVGATALGSSAAAIGEVDIDSDTTELELPQPVYNALKAAIGNDSAFTAHFGGPSFFANADCILPLDGTPPTPDALDAVLPTITLMLDDGAGGSTALTLNATTSYLEPITVSGVTKYCPEIEPSGSSSTIVGSSFVRSQIVIYDIAGSRVGFAPYAGCAVR